MPTRSPTISIECERGKEGGKRYTRMRLILFCLIGFYFPNLRIMDPARLFTTFFLFLAFVSAPELPAVEVLELSAQNFEERPAGKEAYGIVGDFVLRNDKVELLISGDLPLRGPNMGGLYGEGNHTPIRRDDPGGSFFSRRHFSCGSGRACCGPSENGTAGFCRGNDCGFERKHRSWSAHHSQAGGANAFVCLSR